MLQEKGRILYGLLWGALALAGLWAVLHFLLPWLAPFLIALALAALAEPAVQLLSDKLHLPRWGASALCILALAAGVLGVLGAALWRLVYEAGVLLGRVPALLAGLPAAAEELERWVYRFLMALPAQLRELIQASLDGLLREGIALPDRLYGALAETAGALVSALPEAALFGFTTALAAYFTSAQLPELRAGFWRLLPARWRESFRLGWREAKRTLGGWARAQGVLMLVTFGEVAVGLRLLGVEPFLLPAVLIALVDALPVFGTGTVLLPWGAMALLGGETGLGLGLLVLYGLASLVRSLLEPRLIGAGMGLPPLWALMAMYVGFKALGVAGMILAPLGTALACQLWRLFRRQKNCGV